MNFTSLVFIAFCLCFYPLYFLVANNVRSRNRLVLLASYLFYGWWDWRFLFLIILTCTIDYKVAQWIEDTARSERKRHLLWISLVSNLGVLGFFKYFNFFIGSFKSLLGSFGLHEDLATLRIILPVGISFYTFQSLSYIFDVYRGKFKCERDACTFFTYVAFFPQLAAGPIERASHMLPQFRSVCFPSRDSVQNGAWLIIRGFFTKMVVADTLAPWIDINFQANQTLGWSSILATVAFGIQIYGDFQGYSLLAKGLAALMGIQLMWNFNFPYWATSVQDFWHRWHISLSTWLRDYLYIPLGGSRASPKRVYFNIMLTMLLGGLWHGAGWNFVIWGLWHGMALCCNHAYRRTFGELRYRSLGWLVTLLVVLVGWFFFRATDYSVWWAMLGSVRNMEWLIVHTAMLRIICLTALPLAILEYAEFRRGQDRLAVAKFNWLALAFIEAAMLIAIFAVSQRPALEFIYFQF
jgi:alginate O-acetyltransferase complex protein AlgI